jgi:hypothetical protein
MKSAFKLAHATRPGTGPMIVFGGALWDDWKTELLVYELVNNIKTGAILEATLLAKENKAATVKSFFRNQLIAYTFPRFGGSATSRIFKYSGKVFVDPSYKVIEKKQQSHDESIIDESTITVEYLLKCAEVVPDDNYKNVDWEVVRKNAIGA